MRCKACDSILNQEELRREDPDWDYCTICRTKSMEEFTEEDRQYVHGELTDVKLDGTCINIDLSYLDLYED